MRQEVEFLVALFALSRIDKDLKLLRLVNVRKSGDLLTESVEEA